MGRLKQYLLREAKVRKTNADVFLDDYAPIFMYKPDTGLIWARYDTNIEEYVIYEGNKKIARENAFLGCLSHLEMLSKIKVDEDIREFIRGRISPDGKTIFVHDLSSRYHYGMDKKRYDRLVNKAVDAVYRYMKDYIN